MAHGFCTQVGSLNASVEHGTAALAVFAAARLLRASLKRPLEPLKWHTGANKTWSSDLTVREAQPVAVTRRGWVAREGEGWWVKAKQRGRGDEHNADDL